MKGKVQVSDVKLGDISIAVVFKAMRRGHCREWKHQYQTLNLGRREWSVVSKVITSINLELSTGFHNVRVI